MFIKIFLPRTALCAVLLIFFKGWRVFIKEQALLEAIT